MLLIEGYDCDLGTRTWERVLYLQLSKPTRYMYRLPRRVFAFVAYRLGVTLQRALVDSSYLMRQSPTGFFRILHLQQGSILISISRGLGCVPSDRSIFVEFARGIISISISISANGS